MEFYILLSIIFIVSLVKKIPNFISTICVMSILLASFIVLIAPDLREDMLTDFEPLLKYKNTCNLDYSGINSSEFFKNSPLDCSKIYRLDKENSPLYQISKKISLTNIFHLFQKKIKEGDILKIIKSIPYKDSIMDLDNNGFITKKEKEDYIKINGDKEYLLESLIRNTRCDRFNMSLNYCDYNKFKDNFSQYSVVIMRNILKYKAIPFTVLMNYKI